MEDLVIACDPKIVVMGRSCESNLEYKKSDLYACEGRKVRSFPSTLCADFASASLRVALFDHALKLLDDV
jgi:hypothetical protein